VNPLAHFVLARLRHRALAAAWLLAALTGCAGLPAAADRPESRALAASADTELGRFAQKAGLQPAESGFHGLPQAEYALDARIALIRRAQRSIDLQTYQIGNDFVGRTMLRELRDAAQRGVRVRLLVDDFYTLGMDRPLLQLAAHQGIGVRLYNPFVIGRDSATGRFINLLGDGRRLNHRMHNKMLVVDGAWAVVGGRNLSDEYFMRSTAGNFLDVDFLIAGAVVPELAGWFDRYWNHARVVEIERMSDDGLSADARRAAFDAFVATTPPHQPPTEADMLGVRPLGLALARGAPELRPAKAAAFADDPDKTFDPVAPRDQAQPDTTLAWIESRLAQPRSESILLSPYFLPDERMRRRLSAVARDGARIVVLTNGVASSDEPLVAFASHRHRDELLAAGVRLFEVRASASPRSPLSANAPSGGALRLHAKMGVFDRRLLGIGSINLDPRSHRINTELAILIDSPGLASDVAEILDGWMASDEVHEVVRSPQGVSFRVRNGTQVIESDEEPGLDAYTRLRLLFFYLLVPDELL
jgi:putative cardiolipin synthase